MRQTLRKFFWAWDFDKEEQWLNGLAAKGLHLAAIGWPKYIFDEGVPGAYQIRLELLDNWPTHPESQQYIRFVEETGAEYLGSVLRWAYFRKAAGEEGFDLFSDRDTRIKHLNRLMVMLGVPFVVSLMFVAYNMRLYFSGSGVLANLIAAIVLAVLALLVGYGVLRTWLKRRKLKKDRLLYE